MGLTVSEEDLTIAENIVGLDHHPLHRNKNLHELLICYIHIHDIEIARDAESRLEMYIKLLRNSNSDGFPNTFGILLFTKVLKKLTFFFSKIQKSK